MAWEKDDAWSKKSGPRRPRGRTRHAKPDASAESGGASSTWETSRRRAEKRQKRRRTSWILGAVTLVIVLLVMLAPTIAGAVAPGVIADAASGAIAGRVEVGSVSLSWFGGQRVEQVRLYDTDDERRGELSVTADKGLLALLFAGGDYGTVTLSGELDASENDKGEAFTEHTVRPAPASGTAATPPASAAAAALPKNLRVTLELDDLSVRYARPAHAGPVEAVRLEKISGSVRVDTSAESVVDLNARLERRPSGAADFERSGSLAIDATATGLTDADGTLTPNSIAFETSVSAKDLQTEAAEIIADMLPPVEGGLADALGRTVTLNATVEGGVESFVATLDLLSDALRAHAPLAIDLGEGTIASTEPITARADTERLSRFLPDRAGLVGADAPVRVTEFPAVSLTVDALRAPIPEPGAALDLRAAGASVTAEIGRLAGTVPDPAGGADRAVGFEPATVTLDAADLTQPVALRTTLGTLIDGERSGTLTVDITASGVLDDEGAPSTTDLPEIAGGIRAERLALQALQPVAQAFSFDLVGVLGDTADLTIDASPAGAGATSIAISGESPRARVEGNVALEGSRITTAGAPLTVTLDRPDAAIAPYLADAGIEIAGASGLELALTDLSLDLERLGTGDLSSLAADLTATLASLDATVADTGERVSVQNAVFGVRSPGLARGARVKMSNKFTLAGAPAGRIDADLTAADLLDEAGAFTPGLPSNVRGTVTLGGVRTAALGAFVPLDALDLPADVGPTLDATAALEPRADAHTAVALSITSEKLNGTGDLAIGADGVTGGADALSLELAAPGPLLERLVNTPDGPVAITAKTPGRLTLRAADLELPLDPDAMTREGRASVTATLSGLALVGPNGPAGTVKQLGAAATLSPGTDPTVTLSGTLVSRHAGETLTGTIGGSVALANAFETADDNARLRVAPNGEIRAENIPINFARLIGTVFPGAEGEAGLPLDRALRDAMGTTASLVVRLERDAADPDAPLRTTLDADAGSHTLDATLAVTPTGAPDMPFAVTDLSADARVALDEATVRTALAIASPGAPTAPSVTSPGAVTLKVRNDRGTLRADATIDATTIEGLSVPAGPGDGAAPRQLDPITLAGTAGATIPLAFLNEPDAPHAVGFTADLSGADAGDRRVVSLVANGRTTLERGLPTGETTAEVRASSRRTAWVDALAGQDGLLTAALGDRFQIRADLSAAFPPSAGDLDPDDPMPVPDTAAASVLVDAPLLRTASPASVTIENGTLRLTEPLRAAWSITPDLFAHLAPVEPGKAAQVALAAPVDLAIAADRMVLPLGGASATPDFSLTADASSMPLRFADGSSYRLTDLALRLASMPEAGKGRLVVGASTEDAGQRDSKPIALDATVSGLPRPDAVFDPKAVALDGVATIDDLPMRLIDALGGADGLLVALLGPALDAEATVRDLPQRRGGLAFRATTAQASARYAATVRPHPAAPETLALVADEPATAEITHFDYDFAGRKVSVFPVFGQVTKVKNTHRPASVRVTRLVTPVDGDVSKIIMRAAVDPGVINYKFDRGLEALLKAAKQRTESNAGERLRPFEVTMRDGIARFDKLAVPVGEFTMTANGAFDLVRRTEDITLGIPAGAFATEVIGALQRGPGLLNEDIVVPVRRRGPMDAENPWEPDFEAVLQQLFSPENILKNVIDGGLKDLINDGLRPGGG